jgi:hypothetical protein
MQQTDKEVWNSIFNKGLNESTEEIDGHVILLSRGSRFGLLLLGLGLLLFLLLFLLLGGLLGRGGSTTN